MARLLVIACDGLEDRLIGKDSADSSTPFLTRCRHVGAMGWTRHPGPALPGPVWGGLATGDETGPLALPVAGRMSSGGACDPVASWDWRRPPAWAFPRTGDDGVLVVNWPGTYPVVGLPESSRVVSDGWFADPLAPDGLSASIPDVDLLREMRVDAASLDPGIMGLLLEGLTPEEVAADERTARLARSVARGFSVVNVSAALLGTEPWSEAWIRMPFLGEVSESFGAVCRVVGDAPMGAEWRRRYGCVLGAAHRWMDSWLTQAAGAAGEDVMVVILGGWRRRSPAFRWNGPLGHLGAREPHGTAIVVGPGVSPGASIPGIADALLRWVREVSGQPSAPFGLAESRFPGQPGVLSESLVCGLREEVAADAGYREIDDPGLARWMGLADRWFNAVRRVESGAGSSALVELVDVWKEAPELEVLTLSLGNLLRGRAAGAVLVRLAEILADDGTGDAARALAEARLLLDAGRLDVVDRIVAERLRVAPEVGWRRLEAELCLRRGQTEAAFRLFGALVREDTRDLESWVGLTRCYVKVYRLADARAAVRHLRAEFPGHWMPPLLEADFGNRFGAAMSSSPREGLGDGDEDVAPPVHAGADPALGWVAVEQLRREEACGVFVPTVSQRERFRWIPGGWKVGEEESARVWLDGDPARIAGFASWNPEKGGVRLRWMVRARWRERGEGAEGFLRSVVSAIRQETPGAPVWVTLGAGTEMDAAFTGAGFRFVGRDELRLVHDLRSVLVGLDARMEQWRGRSRTGQEWRIRDGEETDVEWLLGLFQRPGLLAGAQCQAQLADPVGRLVLVAELEGQRVGAVLLRQRGVEIEFCVENAELPSRRDWIPFKLEMYRAICRRAIALGVATLRLTTNPATNLRVIHFTESIGARPAAVGRHFVLPSGPVASAQVLETLGGGLTSMLAGADGTGRVGA